MASNPLISDNWEPSEEMLRIAGLRMSHAESLRPFSHYQLAELALKAVRDLIIAEARPQIEAAERERVLEEAARIAELYNMDGPDKVWVINRQLNIAKKIRALKDSKPSPNPEPGFGSELDAAEVKTLGAVLDEAEQKDCKP